MADRTVNIRNPYVVGLDLALTKTGIAYANGDTEVFDTKKLRGMARLEAIVRHVMAACDVADCDPDLVVVEGYSLGSTGRLLDLAELGGIVRYRLHCAGIAFIEVPPQTLKIYATGTAKSDKFAMVAAAQQRLAYAGHQPDEADALWLRAYGLAKLDCPLVTLPLTHTRALAAVELPERSPTEDPWPPNASSAAASGTPSRPVSGP